MMRVPANNNSGKKHIVSIKKRLQRSRLFAVGMCIILTGALLKIRNMHIQLEKMQDTILQMETQQNRVISVDKVTSKEATAEEDSLREESYVQSIDRIVPEKPIQRTREEAVQKLRELGRDNSVIETIYQNSSLYPENMLVALANNPEMADFAAGYLSEQDISFHGLTDWEREQDFPLLLQWDPRWGYEEYGDNSNIGLAGCGPTCLSMVLYYLTGREDLTPDKIGCYAMENGYWVEGVGTAWALLEDLPVYYGISVGNLRMEEADMKAELDQGNLLICAMSAGDFTAAGHFIVVYGYDSSGFLVNDPNCVARSRKSWSFSELEKQLKSVWFYGK